MPDNRIYVVDVFARERYAGNQPAVDPLPSQLPAGVGTVDRHDSFLSGRSVPPLMSTEEFPMPPGFADAFWRRHSNPMSGWSRVLTLPAVLYAVYHRKWRLLAAAVVFVALNPFLFSPPETDDALMTRVVLAERWWTDEMGRGLLDLSYPKVLNVPTTAYALLSAYRQRPIRTALAGGASMALKFWFVGTLVRHYDRRTSGSSEGNGPG